MPTKSSGLLYVEASSVRGPAVRPITASETLAPLLVAIAKARPLVLLVGKAGPRVASRKSPTTELARELAHGACTALGKALQAACGVRSDPTARYVFNASLTVEQNAAVQSLWLVVDELVAWFASKARAMPAELSERFATVSELVMGFGSPEAETKADRDLPEVDLPAGKITWRGRSYDAGVVECQIVSALIAEPGHVVTAEEIMRLRGCRGKNIPRVVKAMREKWKDLAKHIESKPGSGYRWKSG